MGLLPFFEVLGIVPIGVALGLPAVPVMIFAFAGNIFAIWLLIVMTSRVRGWLERRRERKGKDASKKREKRAAATWEKYGLPDLTMLAPILIGSHLGAILAMHLKRATCMTYCCNFYLKRALLTSLRYAISSMADK